MTIGKACLFSVGLAVSVGSLWRASGDGPPLARPPVRLAAEEYFGQRVVDPYRWMEDMKNPELLVWIKNQSEYSRRYLDGLSSHQDFLKRQREVETQGTVIERIRREGERYVYVKQEFASRSARLCVRDRLTGPEKVLAATPEGSEHPAIDEFDVSPDDRYVAYVTSTAGREVGDLHVVDVNSGSLLPDVIKETDMIEPPGIKSFSGTWWAPDSRSLVYRKLGTSGSLQGSQVMLHTLGMKQTEDLPLFEPWTRSDGPLQSGLSFVWFTRDASYLIAQIGAAGDGRKEFFIASTSHLRDKPIPWRRVNSRDDQIRDISTHGATLFLRTSKNAPRFEILRVSATDSGVASGRAIFPAGDAVVEASVPAKDGLYVQTLHGGERTLYRIDYQSWTRQMLPIPPNISARIMAADPAKPGVLLQLESWTEPPSIVAWDPEAKKLTNTEWLPQTAIKMPALEVERINVPSHDGVLVPLVIISPQNRDPRRPTRTMMFGYGASGVEWTAPYFASRAIPWFETGGIQAWVGARGGGEYGEEWQNAGTGVNKPNTWKDFIACAEYLIRRGYTTSHQLAAVAVSAGGILAGNALAERPDLFSAVVISAGLMNPLRLSFTEFGKGHPEFGRIGSEQEFRATLAMDPYQKIRDGVNYPAVLLIHGINDPRVPPYFSAKFAARLQADTTSGKPILLDIDYGVGHGVLSAENVADQMAFVSANTSEGPER